MRYGLIITSSGKAIRKNFGLSSLDKIIIEKMRKQIMNQEDTRIFEKLQALDLFIELIKNDKI